MRVFEGGTADEVWRDAYADVPTWTAQASRAGPTREALRATFVIADPRQRWVASRTPPISPALAIAEVAWILAGDDRLSYLLPWNADHAKFVGDAPHVHGAYGARLRRARGVDQILGAAAALRANPESRQVVLQIYDPAIDLPSPDGAPRSPDVPCNVTALLKVRDGRLEWTQVLRSNDLHLGVPYNLVQFTTLQEVVAGLVGVEVGAYAHYADSLHVYERDVRGHDLPAPFRERNEDDLRLPAEGFEAFVERFHACLERIGVAENSADVERALDVDLTPGWKNLALVCAAERARRIDSRPLAKSCLDICGNRVLVIAQEAYAFWKNRR